ARYEVVGYYFETGVKEAVARNSQRSGKQLIPERGIYGTQKRLVRPTLAEGFDRLYRVRLLPEGNFAVEELQPVL
ncbi:kinase, partial [Pontibacter sp. HJ8]